MRNKIGAIATIFMIPMACSVSAADKINAIELLKQAGPQLMYSAHGIATDNNGEPFQINQETIYAAQNRLLATLHKASAKAVAADSRALLQNVYEATDDSAERYVAKLFLTHFLTEALLAEKKYVLKHVNEKLSYRTALFGKLDPNFIKRLIKIAQATPRNAPPDEEDDDEPATMVIGSFGPVPDWMRGAIFPESGLQTPSTGYMRRCVNNGVPLPPDFGSPLWDYIGKIGAGFIYAYAPKEPAGACMTLARPFTPGGNDVAQIGIICNGYESGNACFWDRDAAVTGRNGQPTIIDRIQVDESTGVAARGESIDGDFLQGAAAIGDEQCTRCHLGENPYLVRPGEFTDVAGQLGSNGERYQTGSVARWYTPLFRGNSWPDNRGPYALRDLNNNGVDDLQEPPPNRLGIDAMTALLFNLPSVVSAQSCISCHNLPAPQVGSTFWRVEYCRILRSRVASMPPNTSATAHWSSRYTVAENAFSLHVDEMHDLCPGSAP